MGNLIVHGDFRLDNLIYSSDLSHVAALLDWEMATIGDPLTDLGLLLVYCDPVCAPVLPHGLPVSGSDSFPPCWPRDWPGSTTAMGGCDIGNSRY